MNSRCSKALSAIASAIPVPLELRDSTALPLRLDRFAASGLSVTVLLGFLASFVVLFLVSYSRTTETVEVSGEMLDGYECSVLKPVEVTTKELRTTFAASFHNDEYGKEDLSPYFNGLPLFRTTMWEARIVESEDDIWRSQESCEKFSLENNLYQEDMAVANVSHNNEIYEDVAVLRRCSIVYGYDDTAVVNTSCAIFDAANWDVDNLRYRISYEYAAIHNQTAENKHRDAPIFGALMGVFYCTDADGRPSTDLNSTCIQAANAAFQQPGVYNQTVKDICEFWDDIRGHFPPFLCTKSSSTGVVQAASLAYAGASLLLGVTLFGLDLGLALTTRIKTAKRQPAQKNDVGLAAQEDSFPL